MEYDSLAANGIPDTSEALTPQEIKKFRMESGYYLRPTYVLRLLDPYAYFSGLIWELEEILKVQHDKLKNRYNYYSGNSFNMELSESEYAEEFQLNMVKNLFLREKGNRIVPDSQLHDYNTPEPIFVNQSATNAKEGAANSDEVANHEEELRTSLNCSSQNSQKEVSQQGTKQASCSDTQKVFSLCCNNVESGISRDKIISGFDNRCHEHINKNKAIEGTEVSRSENKYTDSLSQDTAVKEEQQNFKHSPVSWVLLSKDINGSSTSASNSSSYGIQEVYQAPVIHLTAQPYNMIEHST